jgi:homoserine O-succinyltransferase
MADKLKIDIALVNNMPDGALQTTERQFISLLHEAAGDDFDVRVSLYALAAAPRSEQARRMLRERYADSQALTTKGADALIVTGAEPKAASLPQEPYWRELTGLIDWAQASTLSSLWSCLAAHAAVQHLDGVARQPLPSKCSGVYTFERRTAHPLTDGLPGLVRTPHSRRNALPVSALESKGYEVLTLSPRAGADVFVRAGQSLFVFFQGHPEYDADSLLREYCRDFGRFLRGEQQVCPQTPFGYFDAETERAFKAIAARARQEKDLRLISACSALAARMKPARRWRTHAVMLIRNWLEIIASAKAEAGVGVLDRRRA